MGDELHKLYLFEFLVHSVTYNNSTLKLDPNFLKNLGPTCVQFKGKHLPSFIVSEIDFCSKDSFNINTVKFKSGKSSLFSLGHVCFDECRLNCEVTLKRKLPEGEDSNYYCIGKNTFCLNQKFINVLNSPGSEAVSQCLKLSLDMKNQLNETVATVRMLLRLTCFGTVIVTEFQKNFEDSKAFLFKGDRIVPAEEESCETLKAENINNNIVSKEKFNKFRPMTPSQMPMQPSQMRMQPPQMPMQPPQMPMQPPQMPMQLPQMSMQLPQMAMQPPQMTMQPPQMAMQPPQMAMQPPQMAMQPPYLPPPQASLQTCGPPPDGFNQLPMNPPPMMHPGFSPPQYGFPPPMRHSSRQECYPVAGYF